MPHKCISTTNRKKTVTIQPSIYVSDDCKRHAACWQTCEFRLRFYFGLGLGGRQGYGGLRRFSSFSDLAAWANVVSFHCPYSRPLPSSSFQAPSLPPPPSLIPTRVLCPGPPLLLKREFRQQEKKTDPADSLHILTFPNDEARPPPQRCLLS